MSKRGHGEGSVYRDGPRWIAAVSRRDRNGKRKRRRRIAATQREALQKLRELQREVARDDAEAVDETVSAFLDRWLRDVVAPTRRPKTYGSHESIIRMHLKPALGSVRLSRLRPDDVQTLLNQKLASGLSPRTVVHIRATFHAAMNHALRWGLVSRNVVALTTPPQVPTSEIDPLSPSDAKRVIEAVRGDWVGSIVEVALGTGLRQGEILGLRWSDIDFETSRLRVRRVLQRTRDGYIFAEPKTHRSRRGIPVPSIALRALKARRAQQLEDRLRHGVAWDESDLVFTNASGGPLYGPNVTRRFQHLLGKAGLPRMRFHYLRHSCASLLLAEGVPLKVASQILGHSSIATTANVYVHVLEELNDEAAAAMDRALA